MFKFEYHVCFLVVFATLSHREDFIICLNIFLFPGGFCHSVPLGGFYCLILNTIILNTMIVSWWFLPL